MYTFMHFFLLNINPSWGSGYLYLPGTDLNNLDSELYQDVSLVISQIVTLKKCPYILLCSTLNPSGGPMASFWLRCNSLKNLECTLYNKALS